MKSWLRHPLRVSGRLVWLAGTLFLAACNYALRCAFCPRSSLPQVRAAWLQTTARQVLRVFCVETQCAGAFPASGLLVCNHLSYLDIPVLAALVPCVFVAKQEVKHWPVFGWFAMLAGTVFVRRERRTQTAQTVDVIQAALQTGALVVVFPEGTSSDGQTVLPFKSSLLEAATRNAPPLVAGLLAYALADGDVREEVCYWKDMTLLPHLINLCSKQVVKASVQFNPVHESCADRKQLARRLHAEVLQMKQGASLSTRAAASCL